MSTTNNLKLAAVAAAVLFASAAHAQAVTDGTGSTAGQAGVAIGTAIDSTTVGSEAGAYGTAVGGGDYGWGPNGMPLAGGTSKLNIAGMYGSAYGFASQAQGRGDTAIGAYANTGSPSPLGASDDSQDSYRTAVGYKASATGEVALALGSYTSATGLGSVALGYGSVATDAMSVSVGTAGFTRTIENVTAGVNATDAVNVAQLQGVQAGLQTQISQIATNDAANAAAVAKAQTTGNTATATAQTAQSMANAAQTASTAETARAESAEVTLQQNMVQGNAQTLQSANAYASASSAQALQQANSYTDQQFGQAESDIHTLREDMYGGVASALAVAGLPQPTQPGRSMVSVATSNYQGQQGFAAGYSYVTPNDKWVVKAAVTSNSRGEVGGTVGAGYQW